MKKIFIALLLMLFSFLGFAKNYLFKTEIPTIIGRWDITIDWNGKPVPSWLEVNHSGNILVGQYVGIVGSARPISRVNFNAGKINFTIPPQWEGGQNDITFEGTLNGNTLSGTMTSSDGKVYTWNAVRAPALIESAEPAWGESIQLFNGKDTTGWHAQGKNQWVVENGVLRSPHSGSNLLTDGAFKNFKLHIEFRYPKGSNSGVYLRGRYEVQIEDDEGDAPNVSKLGAIYGFIAPSGSAGKPAGEWQAYDIILVGRMVTIVLNGVTLVCNREIPGITGGAINSNESEPGPLLIQGDHGPIEYRNIVLTPAKE